MGRTPRDTRKRRIRAGEHKIRRMDLKGFERIVARSPAFGKSLVFHLHTSPCSSVERVDVARVPSGLRVRDSRRESEATVAERRAGAARGEGHFGVSRSRRRMGKTVFLAGWTSERRAKKLRWKMNIVASRSGTLVSHSVMLRLVEIRSVKFCENIHSAAPTDNAAVLYDHMCTRNEAWKEMRVIKSRRWILWKT